MTGPLISNMTVVSAMQIGIVSCLAAAVIVCILRLLKSRFLQLTPMQMAIVLLTVCIATASAQKSGTNSVDDVGGTNVTDNADGELPPPLMMRGAPNLTLLPDPPSLIVSPADAVRGYRLDSVATNEAISYTAPDDATEFGTWRLTGAYDDVVRADLGEFRFPLGTNLCPSLWAHTWGTARPRLRNVSNELVAVGAPMSAISAVSRFWTTPTTNDTFLLTWQDFALGRIPAPTNTSYLLPLTSNLFSAQLELYRNGDFIARSNNVESVYRRVNPDDWDDDGWRNDEDSSPYEADEDGFGPHQDLSFIVHSNNYYWVDFVVSNANALVSFESELPSDLPNPQFVARAGATNRVVLLLGKPYEVKCAQPIVCMETSHSDVEVMERCEGWLAICRPVVGEFVSMPLLMAPPGGHGPLGLGGGTTLSLSPEPEGYEVTLGDCCCMTQVGGGLPYFYCMGYCGCGGCSSGDISVAYDGTALSFPGYSCPCTHDPNPGGDDPQDDPSGPSVSASFSKQAVIFEEAYTNMPGVVVPRQSTDVEVSYYVNGGTNGGTYAFTLVNGAKLLQVDGGTLPVTGHVAAAESFMMTARYEGRAASGSEGDIIAKAEFTEDETGQTLTDTHSMLTAIKVELSSVETATANPDNTRHVYGIAEDVRYRHWPVSVEVDFSFPPEMIPRRDGVVMCPCNAIEGTFNVMVGSCGVSYSCLCTVVKPMIEARNSRANQNAADVFPIVGEAGHLLLYLDMYVLPAYVSFHGLEIREIPDESQSCFHCGYYDDRGKGGNWSHTRNDGAGTWNEVEISGFYAVDMAGRRTGYAEPLSYGWKEWAIPMDWGMSGVSLGDFQPNPTTQKYTLGADGTFEIRKHNHWASRTVLGWVLVDGMETW